MASAAAPSSSTSLEVYVKARPGTDAKVMGDCPFSHRILLTVEEKGLKHVRYYIDFACKPDWFLAKFPAGTVPVICDDGAWVGDSDAIAKHLETRFPEPSLATTEAQAAAGSGVFGAFVKHFKAAPEDVGATGDALVAELASLDAFLKEHGPYIGGEGVCAQDLAVYPKLKHMQVALGHFRKWTIPEDLAAVRAYIALMADRASAKATLYPDDAIVEGWAPKFPSQKL